MPQIVHDEQAKHPYRLPVLDREVEAIGRIGADAVKQSLGRLQVQDAAIVLAQLAVQAQDRRQVSPVALADGYGRVQVVCSGAT